MTVEDLLKDKNFQKIIAWHSEPRRAYFQPIFEIFNEPINLTPNYNKELKIGVVIGTYGALPYIDLQLHYLKNVNGINRILVHDDCSPQKEVLKNLCDSYKVDFYSTENNMWHMSCVGSLGDENCFFEGLKWAKQNKLDILVKISRRLIPCYRWIDDFKKLIKISDGLTFSSYCVKDRFPIRTECIGMNVNAWAHEKILNIMNWYIQNEFPIFAEYWYNEIAREIGHFNRSKNYLNFINRSLYKNSGYVMWKDILGINRYTRDERHENVLWHMNSSIEDYMQKAKEVFGEKYSLDDFKEIVNI